MNSIGRKEECLLSKKITGSIELWQYKGNLLLCISLCEKKDFLKIDARLSEVTEMKCHQKTKIKKGVYRIRKYEVVESKKETRKST